MNNPISYRVRFQVGSKTHIFDDKYSFGYFLLLDIVFVEFKMQKTDDPIT